MYSCQYWNYTKPQLKSPSLSPLCLNIGVRLPPQFQLNVPQVSKETKTRLRLWQKYVEIIDSVRNSGDWIQLAVLLETQNAVITDDVAKSDTVPGQNQLRAINKFWRQFAPN